MAESTTPESELLPTRKTEPKIHKKILIDGVRRKHSHYVWFLNTGHWPDWKNKRETIHHIDGNDLNDNFSNLQLMTHAEHLSLHRQGGGCIVDKMVNNCGPYRYLVTKHNGIQTWKYLGKTSDFIGLVNEATEKGGNT